MTDQCDVCCEDTRKTSEIPLSDFDLGLSFCVASFILHLAVVEKMNKTLRLRANESNNEKSSKICYLPDKTVYFPPFSLEAYVFNLSRSLCVSIDQYAKLSNIFYLLISQLVFTSA